MQGPSTSHPTASKMFHVKHFWSRQVALAKLFHVKQFGYLKRRSEQGSSQLSPETTGKTLWTGAAGPHCPVSSLAMSPSAHVGKPKLAQRFRNPAVQGPNLVTRRFADHQNTIRGQERRCAFCSRPRCSEGPGGHQACSAAEVATCNLYGIHGMDLDAIGNIQLAGRPAEERAPPITTIHQNPPIRRQGGQNQTGYTTTGPKVDCNQLGIQIHRYAFDGGVGNDPRII